MNLSIAIGICITLYGLATICLLRTTAVYRITAIVLGTLALLLHACLLHSWIDTTQGQNLSYPNLISLILWLVALLTLLTNIRLPLLNLMRILFPLAGLSILTVALFPSIHLVQTQQNPHMLIHVLLSLVTASVLSIAACQALFLALQDYALRDKQTTLLQWLPPLQTMEAFLFQTIALGFILLSLLSISSIVWLGNLFTPSLWQASLLTSLSWLIFAILLLGHYVAGWRGKIAIRSTLCSFVLLILAYASIHILTG